MAWRTWRGVLGGSLATLLLTAPAMLARGETTPQVAHPGVAKTAPPHASSALKTKPKVAAKHETGHPAKKIAAAKLKPQAKHLAAAKAKPIPKKKIEVVKKAEPATLAAAAKPAPASYTITSVHDGVTQTTTRVVPLAETATVAAEVAAAPPPPAPPPGTQIAMAAPAAKPAEPRLAATPVSLTEPAKPSGLAAAAAMSLGTAARKPQPAAAPATQPANPKEAAAFISTFLREAFRIAKSDGTSLQRRARLAELFADHMDVKRIAGYTAGDELAVASGETQQRFRTILVSYLVETYYPQLELAADPKVTVDTAPVAPLPDGTGVVWTTFTKDGWGSQSVKWHLVNEGGHYRIVDIFSAGASLVQMERDTFLSVMRKGGLNELMAKLDARTRELASAATE